METRALSLWELENNRTKGSTMDVPHKSMCVRVCVRVCVCVAGDMWLGTHAVSNAGDVCMHADFSEIVHRVMLQLPRQINY